MRKRRPPHVQPSAHMCFRRMFSAQSGGGETQGSPPPAPTPGPGSPRTIRTLVVADTVAVAASETQAEIGVLDCRLAPATLPVPHVSFTTWGPITRGSVLTEPTARPEAACPEPTPARAPSPCSVRARAQAPASPPSDPGGPDSSPTPSDPGGQTPALPQTPGSRPQPSSLRPPAPPPQSQGSLSLEGPRVSSTAHSMDRRIPGFHSRL